MANDHRSSYVPEYWSDHRKNEHARKLGQAINGLLKGRSNNHFAITLSADSTQTSMNLEFARPGQAVILSPQTSAAAAALANGLVYAVSEKGRVVVHHDESPATDRSFQLVVIG